MERRQGYTQRMTLMLRGWMARFDARRREATKAGVVGADARERLEAAKVAGDAAVAKLTELRRARAAYGKLRHEMDALWRSMDDGVAVATDAPAPPRRRASDA